MEPDGDLPRGPVVADPLDDRLDRLHLPGTIHLFPLRVIQDSALRFPDPSQDRFLDRACGKRFTRTHGPALALRVQAHIVRILAILLPRIRVHHSSPAGIAIEQSIQQSQVLIPQPAARTRSLSDQILHPFPRAGCLAKVAKDAAAIENISPGEALEKLMLAIESGASRGLRTMGIFVDLNKEVARKEKLTGRTLDENEVRQLRYNAVMR